MATVRKTRVYRGVRRTKSGKFLAVLKFKKQTSYLGIDRTAKEAARCHERKTKQMRNRAQTT